MNNSTASSVEPGGGLSMGRRTLFTLITLILVIVFLELSACAALKIVVEDYSSSQFSADRRGIAGVADAEVVNTPSLKVLHPYLGFVYNPQENTQATIDEWGIKVSSYGFLDYQSPIREAREDTVVILITGGSVAYYFTAYALDELEAQLRQSPFFEGKTIEFVRTALGGYKQPQQLLVLTYLLSQGAHFDMVINLDGFNELALTTTVNANLGIHPTFPASWHWQTKTVLDNKTKSQLGQIEFLKSIREGAASAFDMPVVRSSHLMNLLWHIEDTFVGKKIRRHRDVLNREVKGMANNFQLTGPEYAYSGGNSQYTHLAKLWADASIQMANISRANDIRYWHFLQPNQYHIGSKALSEEEQQVAFSDRSPFKTVVEEGYPIFISAGAAIAENNILFHDLTPLFDAIPESVYEDDCCHLNLRGNQILGEAIGRLIVQDLAKEPHGIGPQAKRDGT